MQQSLSISISIFLHMLHTMHILHILHRKRPYADCDIYHKQC